MLLLIFEGEGNMLKNLVIVVALLYGGAAAAEIAPCNFEKDPWKVVRSVADDEVEYTKNLLSFEVEIRTGSGWTKCLFVPQEGVSLVRRKGFNSEVDRETIPEDQLGQLSWFKHGSTSFPNLHFYRFREVPAPEDKFLVLNTNTTTGLIEKDNKDDDGWWCARGAWHATGCIVLTLAVGKGLYDVYDRNRKHETYTGPATGPAP